MKKQLLKDAVRAFDLPIQYDLSIEEVFNILGEEKLKSYAKAIGLDPLLELVLTSNKLGFLYGYKAYREAQGQPIQDSERANPIDVNAVLKDLEAKGVIK